MTPSTFNHRLLRAKDRALDTLEELCAPAFVPPAPIPTHRDDGTSIPYEERMALFKAQTARCKPDEKRVIVQERATRVRAANAILRTRPIDDNGNPLPTSPQHPEHHARTQPPSPDAAGEGARRFGRADEGAFQTSQALDGPGTAPRLGGARTQPAGSPAGTEPGKHPRSGGPTNNKTPEEESSAFQAGETTTQSNRQVNLPAEIARSPSERADALPDARPPPYALLLSGPLLYAAPPRPRPHPFDDVEGWHGTGMVNLKRYPRRRSRAR